MVLCLSECPCSAYRKTWLLTLALFCNLAPANGLFLSQALLSFGVYGVYLSAGPGEVMEC